MAEDNLEFFKKRYPRVWEGLKVIAPYVVNVTLAGAGREMWALAEMSSSSAVKECVALNPEVLRTVENAGGHALSDIRMDHWDRCLRARKVIIIKGWSCRG
jgi:hypothetical protein